jgi:hypothetical protein
MTGTRVRATLAGGTAGLIAVIVMAISAPTRAQDAPSKEDFQKAAEHYKNAEAAMAAGRFQEAANEYGVAYAITQDPVLFFKIASADDQAGQCDVAVTYYRRYLKEGHPNGEYEKLTRQRIAACAGEPAATRGSEAGAGSGSATGVAAGGGSGSAAGAGAGSGSGSAAAAGTGAGAGAGSGAGNGVLAPDLGGGAGAGSGSDATSLGASLSVEHPSGKKTAAWIAIGGTVAAATVGTVFLLSANATEKDIDDLYATTAGTAPPPFDGATQKRYDDLVSQGKRFNTLAAVSFGVAGVAAGTGIVLFILDHGHHHAESAPGVVRVTPALGPGHVGVVAGVTW